MVVCFSAVALFVDPCNSSFALIRIVRVFRVIRVFKRLESVRLIVNALASSLYPLASALVILALVTAIYAVLGVEFFSELWVPAEFYHHAMHCRPYQ